MGSVYYTLVGHFNPAKVCVDGNKDLAVSRPIEGEQVDGLLREYPPVVGAQVRIIDGYARCQWAPATNGEDVVDFAYRLARLAGCLAVENGRQVTFPPAAVRIQAEVEERVTGTAGHAERRVADAQKAAHAFEEKLKQRAEGERPRAARLSRALDEIGKRRFAHVERAGCFVKDDQGWPSEEIVRDTLEACGGEHAYAEEMLNRRFVIADVLDAIAPGETWAAADLREVAKAVAARVEKQLGEQFRGKSFTVEVVGAALAEDEPLEVSVTFRRAG